MQKIISFIAIIVLTTACLKNNLNKVLITGRLMENCNTPASNTPLIIKEYDYSYALLSNDINEEFITDENGYFKVKVDSDVKLRLHLKDQFAKIVSGIEVGNHSLDLGEVYSKEFRTNFIIKLDVLNQYTENDTLIIEDYNGIGGTSWLSNKKVKYYPGPFSSGELEIVKDYNYKNFPISHSTYINYNAPELNVGYRIRYLSGEETNNSTKFRLAPICSEEYSEVTLVIE